MKTRSRLPRILLALFACAAIGVGCVSCVTALLSQPRPTSKTPDSSEAEALTDKMLSALNAEAWERTAAVRFRLREGAPLLLWDRARGFVEVTSGDKRVLLDLGTRRAVAFRDGAALSADETRELADDAYATWANDSFWAIAPFKVRDPGTTRSVVEHEGKRQLLVEYSSGGVTPGDAYLWELDDDGRPVAWRMWVKILPVGGARVAWRDWFALSTGAVVARSRVFDIGLTNTVAPFEGAASLEDLVGDTDPFAPLVKELAGPVR